MITARRANRRDSQTILEWRNDTLTRTMSHTNDPVTQDVHDRWFHASLATERRLLVVCEDDDTSERIAIVRFDVEDDIASISINTAPSARGNGLANDCLLASIKFFRNLFPGVRQLNAEVKTVNARSRRTFERVGFLLSREHNGVLYLRFCVTSRSTE